MEAGSREENASRTEQVASAEGEAILMLRGLFAKRAGITERERGESARLKAIVAALLSLPDAEITVSEIVCLDPACPGTETVILVMRPGAKTAAAKVARPAAEVSEPDVRLALLEAGFEVPR